MLPVALNKLNLDSPELKEVLYAAIDVDEKGLPTISYRSSNLMLRSLVEPYDAVKAPMPDKAKEMLLATLKGLKIQPNLDFC